MSSLRAALRRAADVIPAGVELKADDWDTRHRWITGLLVAHVPIIVVFAFARSRGDVHHLAETLPVVALAFVASRKWLGHRARAVAAAFGLMVCSAILVHIAGGATEVHFHFFVMLGVISLYQEWRPFLVAIAFVAVHHGGLGLVRPHDVFDHPAAWENPLTWAAVHAFFVLSACAVSVVSWRIIEDGHRRSRAAIESSERRFRALIENSTDVVSVIDADGCVVYDSPSCEAVLGYSPDERKGTKAASYVHPDDVEHTVLTLGSVTEQPGKANHLEFRVLHRDGGYRWVHVSVTNLLADPAINGVVVNFRDVTERRTLEEQLAHQAFHDPLTGLANRALLLDRLEHACAKRRARGSLALIYIDLDDFKTVNDGLGHETGDELLRLAAERIKRPLRPGDTAARLGGDEFAILLETISNPVVAYEVGARLLEALADPFEVGGELVALNASVGIALSSDEDDAAALLRNADLAMYHAKGGGKGRYEVYEAGMHAAVVERMAVKADLRRAIDAGELRAHYQPIVELGTGEYTGVEALARWHHPQRGLLVPGQFIPLAEESDLIVAIGRQVLAQACADAARWRERFGPAAPRTVSVNLSARQLQDPNLVPDVKAALRSSGLAPEDLILEITETVLLDDAPKAAVVLTSLKAVGVRLALDDFGTGYSSLGYLNRFPVDIVKIDKSFVDSLAGSGGSPLVAAIVDIGTVLGLDVTAEGVEQAAQVARLREIGCGRAQGYYFAEPMPADVFEQALADRAGTPQPPPTRPRLLPRPRSGERAPQHVAVPAHPNVSGQR